MTKENVATAIIDLPQEFDLDELFERLVFMERVEESRKQIKEGKSITHAEMKKKILEWRK